MQKQLSELVLLLLCLSDGIPYVATVACRSESNNTTVYFWHNVCKDMWSCWLMDCQLFCPSSVPSKGCLMHSSQITFKGNEDYILGKTLSLSLFLSAARFLMTRINSHYLPAEEKVTWKTRVGCLSALHLNLFFLLFSAVLTLSHLLSSFQTEGDGTVRNRYSIIRQTGQSLERSFANFYGLRFLLSAVNLPYCDLQWVYVPSSRNIRAPVCSCECVCACARTCVAYHDDSASPNLLLAQLVVEISHWYRFDSMMWNK